MIKHLSFLNLLIANAREAVEKKEKDFCPTWVADKAPLSMFQDGLTACKYMDLVLLVVEVAIPAPKHRVVCVGACTYLARSSCLKWLNSATKHPQHTSTLCLSVCLSVCIHVHSTQVGRNVQLFKKQILRRERDSRSCYVHGNAGASS